MEKENKKSEALAKGAVIDFGAADFQNAEADLGLGFERPPVGDGTWEVVEVAYHTKEGDKGHTMLKATCRLVKNHDGTENGVGLTKDQYYGLAKSPQKSKDRMKAFLTAIKFTPTGAQTPVSEIVGRRFDATTCWTMNAGQPDAMTGQASFKVFADVIAERAVGTARPPQLDPVSRSRRAMAYAEEMGWGGGGAAATAEPNDEGDTTGAGVELGGQGAVGGTGGDSAWIAEEKVPATAHNFRAHIAIGSPVAATARTKLVEMKINPEGPIDRAKLTGEKLTAAYSAKFPPGGDDEGLGDLGDLGGDANGAAGKSTPPKKTGTRGAARA